MLYKQKEKLGKKEGGRRGTTGYRRGVGKGIPTVGVNRMR